MKQLLLISFCIVLFFSNFSCYKSKNSSPCNSQTLCTQEFHTISIRILTAQGQPVSNAEVKTLIGGQTLTFEKTSTANEYVVLTDAQLLSLKATIKTATVQVFQNGIEVKSETYQFGADCCHVFKQSGVEEIILN